MKEQNFKNHNKFVPLFHGVLFLLVLLAIIFGTINLVMFYRGHVTGSWHTPVTVFLLCVSVGIMYWYTRAFATGVQDRAIRAEENLRHFALTGKLLDRGLEISQIVALRFAPDAEFPALAIEALNKKLSNKEIKQQIKNWKADHNRV